MLHNKTLGDLLKSANELSAISCLTKSYLDKYGLTQQKFSAALNENLSRTYVSRVAVTNWCNSKSMPSTDFLLICGVTYKDWRKAWAINCLKVKLPEIFKGEITEFETLLPR